MNIIRRKKLTCLKVNFLFGWQVRRESVLPARQNRAGNRKLLNRAGSACTSRRVPRITKDITLIAGQGQVSLMCERANICR